MQIGIPLETRFNEKRVSTVPETVKKYIAEGHSVIVQKDAGIGSFYSDSLYQSAGAVIVDEIWNAEMILKVHAPTPEELQKIPSNTVLIGMLDPFDDTNNISMTEKGITAFSLEALPRTTRAQSMDVLSSQANISGYKAVILAAHYYRRFMPLLMTAAGTVKAARVLVLGAGVAGLQAIATAKRLGGLIEASDARPIVKEQVESLGAKFIDVPYETEEEREIAQGTAGYAKPMPSSWMKRQEILISEKIKEVDIIITTALIPGRKAPTLLKSESVKCMKAGSVIVDLAAGKGESGGGNCPLTQTDKVINKYNVTLIGYSNLPSMLSSDASTLYSRNLMDFVKLITDTSNAKLVIPKNDDIVSACLICQNGNIIRNNHRK